MDVKAAVDGGLTVVSDLTKMLPSFNGAFLFGLACIAAVYFFARSKIGERARAGLEETMFSNWRLALLGTTGIILSLASGYTTWDGMRNFTGEAVLSAMVTFGIQGVMLIVAWLIGESFAVGMNQIAPDGTKKTATANNIGMLIGVGLVGVTFYSLERAYGGVSVSGSVIDANKFSTLAIYFAFALLILALVVFNRKSDLAQPYVQSTRVVVKSAVLWVMFLACMATSVFFSFDSLFSAIFPQAERQRAAEIRSVNQVAGVVSDIGEMTDKRRIEQAQSLFTLPAWAAYEAELDKAMRLASEAPDKIREQMTRELEAQKSRIAKLEEQKASAQSGQAGLVTRKQLLVDNLARLEVERPEAAQKFAEQKAVVSDAEKRIDEARAKILAEEKGVEGSGKVGRGQFYRAAKGDEEKIQSELQVARERLKGHETRLNTIVRGISTAKAELAQIDGSLANLRGEADTAAQMITMAQSGGRAEVIDRLDPISLAGGLERDRQTFRQKPEQKTLSALQNDCLVLQGVSLKVASLRDGAAAIDCDPKQASEAAGRVFALNAGVENFATACAGGDKLADKKTTDELLAFGRKCLQDSGLPSKDTAEIAAKLSAIDLSRDDKAHRFVVTLNAFQDGNRLAYLALAIAIAIDSLVFMSGLFGANAVRSPLSDVPSLKARSASQLEGIIENSLLPDTYETARATLNAMRPITPVNGFIAEVWMPNDGSGNSHVMGVLNAGATIGAVARDAERSDHYLIRAELYEFLAVVAKKAFEADKDKGRLVQLERAVVVALLRDAAHNVQVLQDALHPMNEDRGFSAEVRLKEAHAHDEPVIRKVLNAGAAFGMVQRVTNDPTHFVIHSDLVRTLSNIQARLMMSGAYAASQVATARSIENSARLPAVEPQSGTGQRKAIAAPLAADAKKNRQQFIDQLLEAIGINPEHYAQVSDSASGFAIAAAAAFAVHRRSNNLLDRRLKDQDDRVEHSLEEAYEAIKEELPAHGQPNANLAGEAYEAHSKLHRHLKFLMLMPSGPYQVELANIVAELEDQAGKGSLKPQEAELLRLARALKERLSESGRQSADDWRRLESAFAATGSDPTVVVLENKPHLVRQQR